MNIRPAISADIPHVMSLERQSATAGHWTEQQYHQTFASGDRPRLLLVVESSSSPGPKSGAEGPGILGFLIAQHLASDWELENIVVAPTARRRGIGKSLLEALFAAAREAESTSVFLEVRESNAPARTLYESLGFEQTARRRSYYASPPEDAILYRRTLG